MRHKAHFVHMYKCTYINLYMYTFGQQSAQDVNRLHTFFALFHPSSFSFSLLLTSFLSCFPSLFRTFLDKMHTRCVRTLDHCHEQVCDYNTLCTYVCTETGNVLLVDRHNSCQSLVQKSDCHPSALLNMFVCITAQLQSSYGTLLLNTKDCHEIQIHCG